MQKVIFENIPLGKEENLVLEYCKENEIAFEFLSAKQIIRNGGVNQYSLVVGSIPFIKQVLQSIDLKLTDNSYPEEFSSLVNRKIYKTITKNLLFNRPVFIKPAKNLKKFTGKIVMSSEDVYGIPRNEEIWVSETMDIKAEYRLYIIDKQIGYIAQYEGESLTILKEDIERIEQAIQQQDKYRNFIMDIALLEDNSLQLLEINDAFSIGAYNDISPELYYSLLCKRWKELTQSID